MRPSGKPYLVGSSPEKWREIIGRPDEFRAGPRGFCRGPDLGIWQKLV